MSLDQVQKLVEWVNLLHQSFPTVDVVESTPDKITLKIRYDDVFRYIYKEIKTKDPTSRVYIDKCDEDKRHGICMFVETTKMIYGWEKAGFDKPIEILHYSQTDDGRSINRYIVTLSSMFKAFEQLWRRANEGKPLDFEFSSRKSQPREGKPTVWLYITIKFKTTTQGGSVGKQ